MRKTFYAPTRVLIQILRKMGYKEIKDRHFKKGIFHFVVHSLDRNKTVLSGHIDYPRKPWEHYRHKAISNDTRIADELEKIKTILEHACE